jgi:peptide subunit release factor 1 (eRF1)
MSKPIRPTVAELRRELHRKHPDKLLLPEPRDSDPADMKCNACGYTWFTTEDYPICPECGASPPDVVFDD